MKAFLARIAGANFRTTLSMIGGLLMGTLTFLSSVSYDQGAIALIIPLEYKPWVFRISGLATLALFIYNGIKQKSKEVTGGNVQQTASGALATPGTQTLMDATFASKESGETLTPEQKQIVKDIGKKI